MAAVMMLSFFTVSVHAEPTSTYNEGGSEGTPAESGEYYNLATTTNPFLIPGNTWVTPEAVHGQDCIVVLPIVNMFKYSITDVIVTPRLSVKTDEFPFEIDNTGYTERIAAMPGTDAQPDYAARVHNCAWVFKTRENVKTGYYKLDFDITYTDASCAVDTTVISAYVKTTGLPENGTTDGEDENKKLSTPRLIVKGFTTTPAEVYSGMDFTLNLTIQNTSAETTVKNLQLDLTATVEGTTTIASYAAFLPASGSNSFYVASIPPGGTADLQMDFQAKAGLEQKPYVMNIKMIYEDEKANPYEGAGSVSIPVKQVSKFDMGTPTVEPASIDIGEQSNIMFSIYNTGKTTLYNVQVLVDDPSLQQELAYVGNLSAGATGNVDMMVTGLAYPPEDSNGTVSLLISYEDESGNVTNVEKPVELVVEQPPERMIIGDDLPDGGLEQERPKWLLPAIIGGGVLLLIIIIIIIVKLVKRHRKKKEEAELADLDYEDDDDDGEAKLQVREPPKIEENEDEDKDR